jgi:hypothetical protein
MTGSQVVNCILQYRDSWQGSIELCQSVLKISGESDILKRSKTRDAKLWSLGVAKGIYFVNTIDCCLDRRVCRRDIILDRRAQ